MNKSILALLLTFLSIGISFSQDANIAAIVDEKTHEIDHVFITKIAVMLFIGIIAFVSYLKFRKTEP
ncbi:MAG: hypothetical protein H6600_08480 [Flavobacteriales bacterium]|nr:hypothetical protein [Flavobacteriales bacterium]MCB9198481.1 hypothetical protein [Flavobacteriales bacterium]